ncbi:hypothetical protein B0A81_05300 [Flavobacterium plurextorum]|uniref:RteC protein n=1 Tax=Flavobacterium plurextorum TaxID=1114867 RepID=A0ABX4CWU0_9FLAO|nr:hypothetical protein [Flavobacterium plurextorum]OXB09550.1 hypothetical protein B0A81_05300 [Flavobacterium plurextorum]
MDIITSNELQEKFDLTIQNNSNRNLKIENEIKAVEEYVYNVPVLRNSLRRQPIQTSINKTPQVFNLGNTYIDRNIFHDAFCKYLNSEEKTIVGQLYNEPKEVHYLKQRSANQAIELFIYYSWLKTLLTKKAKPTITLNHQEKMLALVYLGMDTSKFDKNKTAKILSAILGLSEQNTREILGSLYINAVNNPVRTKKHFENLQNQFKNIGLSEIASNIEEEIKNLK